MWKVDNRRLEDSQGQDERGQDERGQQDTPLAETCLDVWQEKDLMSVEQLSWGRTKPVSKQILYYS